MKSDPTRLANPHRLIALKSTGLLDSAPTESFDRITRLAAKLLGAPVALISLVDSNRQYFKSMFGVPEPLASIRQTPLSHSICQHVVIHGETFKVRDTRLDSRLEGNLAISDLNAIAYLGVPLVTSGGEVLGALCAIDHTARNWQRGDEDILVDLASWCATEIEAQHAAKSKSELAMLLQQAEHQLLLNQRTLDLERRFRFLADAMPQIVWTSKADGNLDYYNQRWFDYTGLTLEQAKDGGWKPALHPDDLDNCVQRWTHAIKTGEAYEIEYRFKRASDGTYRWHLGRAIPMRDELGNIVQWVGTSTDIQEQKQLQSTLGNRKDELEAHVQQRTEQLEKERSFLTAILDSLVDGIAALDETGRTIYCNRAMRTSFNASPQKSLETWTGAYPLYELDGRTLVAREDRPLFQALNGQTVYDRELLVDIGGGKAKRHVVTNSRPIISAEGLSLGAVLSTHDVTDRAMAQSQFQTIFDRSPEPHFLLDDTGVLDCNDAAVSLLGCLSKQEVISRMPYDFSPANQPDGRPSHEKGPEMLRLARSEGMHRFEWLHRRCDGADIPAMITLTTVELNNTAVLLGVAHDLTEQKCSESMLRLAYASLAEANLALRQVEERFHTFMDYSPAAAFIKDEQSRLVYANHRFETVYGATADQLLGKNDFEYLPPEVARITTAADQTVLRTNKPLEKPAQFPFPQGDEGRWMVLKFPLTAPDGKRLVGGIAFDVTSTKQAEREISRQKQFIEAVVENISDVVIACDNLGQITFLNRAGRNLFLGRSNVPTGVEPGNSESSTIDFKDPQIMAQLMLYDPTDGHPVAMENRPMAQSLAGSYTGPREFNVRFGDQNRTVVVSATRMNDSDGHAMGAVATCHDVTELRRSERALLDAKNAADAANKAKSDFLANISHELRTPLTAILGYTDLLETPDESPQQRKEHLHVIRRNGHHLLQVLNDILDLSKIEAGEMGVEQFACSPMEMLRELKALMRPRAAEKNIAFSIEYHGSIPRTVITDPTRLRQILLNLLGNAIKFTHRGSVRVSVGLETIGNQSSLRFNLIDTGIGITPEQQQNLFRPFGQGDASMTRRFGGTGLGLAISKRLTVMLGGELTFTSEPGRGTTFTFAIPVDSASVCALEPQSQWPQQSSTLSPRMTGNILVAEDGPDTLKLVTVYLQALGLTVESAENGRAAVEKLQQAAREGRAFDLVLMDMQMPELDGYAAATELRELGFNRLPIIAFTAHALRGERDMCIRAGCDDYLAKPIDRDELLRIMQKYLPVFSAAAVSESQELGNMDSPIQGAAAQQKADPVCSSKSDDPFVRRILNDFIAGLPEYVARLEESLSAGDLVGLRTLVHQLKGSGGSYGFAQITHHAAAAESAIKSDQPMDQISIQVQSLINLLRRVKGYNPADESRPQKSAT